MLRRSDRFHSGSRIYGFYSKLREWSVARFWYRVRSLASSILQALWLLQRYLALFEGWPVVSLGAWAEPSRLLVIYFSQGSPCWTSRIPRPQNPWSALSRIWGPNSLATARPLWKVIKDLPLSLLRGAKAWVISWSTKKTVAFPENFLPSILPGISTRLSNQERFGWVSESTSGNERRNEDPFNWRF